GVSYFSDSSAESSCLRFSTCVARKSRSLSRPAAAFDSTMCLSRATGIWTLLSQAKGSATFSPDRWRRVSAAAALDRGGHRQHELFGERFAHHLYADRQTFRRSADGNNSGRVPEDVEPLRVGHR